MKATPDPRREKEILEQAIDLASVEDRQRCLQHACEADAGLLARVQELLQAFDQADGFLVENLAGQEPTVLRVVSNENRRTQNLL